MSNGIQKRRRIVTFEPSGPPAAVIFNETAHKGHGAITKFLEEAVMAYRGKKYPKLLQRWEVLYEEKNGEPL